MRIDKKKQYIKLFFSQTTRYIDDKTVVVDGNLVTSRGPATAFEFALKLGEILVGLEKSKEVASGMLYNL